MSTINATSLQNPTTDRVLSVSDIQQGGVCTSLTLPVGSRLGTMYYLSDIDRAVECVGTAEWRFVDTGDLFIHPALCHYVDYSKNEHYGAAGVLSDWRTLHNTTRASTAYMQTPYKLTSVAVNVGRVKCDPLTGAVEGLLHEPAKTNFITTSNAFNTWIKESCTVVDGNVTVTPFSGLTGATLTATANNPILRSNGASAGFPDVFAASVYVRIVGHTNGIVTFSVNDGTSLSNRVQGVFDLVSGVVTGFTALGTFSGASTYRNALIEKLRDGWYRICVRGTKPASGPLQFRISPTITTGQTFQLCGLQIEDTYPTSYIHTTASQVTRAIDGTTLPLPSGFNREGGVFVFDGYCDYPTFGFQHSLFTVNANNGTTHALTFFVTSTGFFCRLYNSSTIVAGGSSAAGLPAADEHLGKCRVAVRFDSTSIAFSVNGNPVASFAGDVGTSITNWVQVIRGNLRSSTDSYHTSVITKKFGIVNKYLTDAELVELTTL